MFISKNNILFLLCCLLLIAACAHKAQTFKEENNINQKFFSKILSSNKSVPNAEKIEIYQTAFVERLTEQNGVIDFAVQNKISSLPYFKYIPSYGYQQHLFLANIQSSTASAWVYFSIKYKADKDKPSGIDCIGFGPGYISDINTLQTPTIEFIRELKIVKDNNDFITSEKGKTSITFIGDTLPFTNTNVKSFDIIKILEKDNNKIGGDRAFVFDVPVIFGDTLAMRFRHYKTINLKN